MNYTPPEELKTNTLKPGDIVQLYASDTVLKLTENTGKGKSLYPLAFSDRFPWVLTPDGYYILPSDCRDFGDIDSPYNVKCVISRAEKS